MKHLFNRKKRTAPIYLCAVLFLLGTVALGLLLGAARIRLSDLFAGIRRNTAEGIILRYVRIPRVWATLVCGGALAVSGAVIQGALANPLASPSIIGVNAGAGLAVTVCSAFGILGGWQLSLFAFLGALLTVMTVNLASKKWGASKGTVILIGVALNSLLGAISDTIVTFIPDVSILSNDFRVGDFSAVTYQRLLPASAVILLTCTLLFTLSNPLDVLSLGDETAEGLGLRPRRTRTLFLILAALLAGAAVSLCGLLSFVGLLVPHGVRRVVGGEAKHLLPLCALFGGGFVTLCDTLARVVFSPYELPVGILMAFLGAPFFLFLLIQRKGGHRCD